MCRSSAAVKLLASESVNIRRTRVRVPPSAILFFFFCFFFVCCFFNIHTSDKLEIFFDHSILVNGVDPWGIHCFPWVNTMSAAFTGTEWVNSGPSQLSKKNIDWFRKSWTLFNIHTSDKLENLFRRSSILRFSAAKPGRHFVYHGESLMHWSAAL